MNFINEIDNSLFWHDKRYANRYLKFIEFCKTRYKSKTEYTEKHHILPKDLWPEYKDEKWNLVRLSGREHFLAHWMLAKAFAGGMLFAFNQMRRIGARSILYNYARQEISNVISECNTGRKMSLEDRRKKSELMKGTVVVKDSDGNKMRVKIDDPRYISGELVFLKCGSTHKKSTIKKMIKNSGIKDKNLFHDENGKICYLPYGIGIGMGLTLGPPDYIKNKCRERVKGLNWVRNKETGQNLRLKDEDIDDSIHERGKFCGPGFDIVNDKAKNKFLNLKTLKFVWYPEKIENFYFYWGARNNDLSKFSIHIFNNYVFLTWKDLQNYVREKKLYPRKWAHLIKRDGLQIVTLSEYVYNGEEVWKKLEK